VEFLGEPHPAACHEIAVGNFFITLLEASSPLTTSLQSILPSTAFLLSEVV
jgi:hypothetical protein